MDIGPGAQPEDYLYLDHKWGVRAVPAGGRVFFYLDGPFDGENDQSFNDIFPWERYLMTDRPNFLLGDYWGIPDCWEGHLVFKQSCHVDSSAQPFYYAVIFEQEPKPIAEAKYFAGFHGALVSDPCRQKIPAALDYSKCYLRANDKLFWEYSEEEQQELRGAYLRLLEDTKFVLCPRGRGLTSIRFFETLRAGRIPVLISDHTKLPLDGFVDWDEIIVRVPENDMGSLMDRLENWPVDHEIASVKARKLSLEYFSNTEHYLDFCNFLDSINLFDNNVYSSSD